MKNSIAYFYDIYADNIVQKDDLYKISSKDQNYILKIFDFPLEKLNSIYSFLMNNGIHCDNLLMNNKQQLITYINNIPYILIKKNATLRDNTLNINSIINFNIPLYNVSSENWAKLWAEKLDYYEYQINQFAKKYPKIRESFSYYNGLSETAIELASLIDFKKMRYYLNHKRINKKLTMEDFYDPTNIIYDVKVRDISEYFKISFFENDLDLNEIIDYFINVKLTNEEAILFLARMLFPTYYFDLYDLVIREKESDEKLSYYIEKIEDYEAFIIQLYNYMINYYSLPNIEWLKK